MEKKNLFRETVRHLDVRQFNAIPLIEQFEHMAFQAKNLANAAKIYDSMLSDEGCTIILCLAGSLFSAGLKKIVYDLVDNHMVDVIVSTGAIMVDQDFFEALGFSHYQGTSTIDDDLLMEHGIDRIYDTFIDEDELRICDMTVKEIADSLPPGSYSSREFIRRMGEYLHTRNRDGDSVIGAGYRMGVPIFIPAFSDCSAGFGLVYHQWEKKGEIGISIDSVKDFLELTRIKINSKDTGLLMIGGGVPKNFAQDVTVAADILGKKVAMHKYAVQVTVADERDGGLSGSTLKEAHSWGKVDRGHEQIVFSEATIALPIIASYAYHRKSFRERKQKNLNNFLDRGVKGE
jgi:deoxyhypusine synthase